MIVPRKKKSKKSKAKPAKAKSVDPKTLEPKILEPVPASLRNKVKAILARTDSFCEEHLNDEYQQLCTKLTVALATHEDSPLERGQIKSWASGILHALGRFNFLFAPRSNPHMTARDLVKHSGVSQGTCNSKSNIITELLELYQFHPEYTLASLEEVQRTLNAVASSNRQAFIERALDSGMLDNIPEPERQAAIDEFLSHKLRDLEHLIFELPRTKDTVLEIEVGLDGTKPKVWRRFLVEQSMPLDRLHAVLQTVMGWDETHLHEFETASGQAFQSAFDEDPEGSDPLEEDIPVGALIKKPGDILKYIYDFGDEWAHTLTLVARHQAKQLPYSLPHCLAGERACPLEDCGGARGHAEVLKCLQGKNTTLGRELEQWIPEGYDPADFDLVAINKELKMIFHDDDKVLIGELPPRYVLMLNHIENFRVTRCFECEERTKLRLFSLLFVVRYSGPFAIKWPCRLCEDCDILVADVDDLEERIGQHVKQPNVQFRGIGTIWSTDWETRPQDEYFLDSIKGQLADFENIVQIGLGD